MSSNFIPGKPIRNLIYGLTHPAEFIQHKPLMAILCYAGMLLGAYYLAVSKGWLPNILT